MRRARIDTGARYRASASGSPDETGRGGLGGTFSGHRGPMHDTLLALFLLAADEGPGRGDDPSGAGGVLIILGVILAVAILAAVAFRLLTSTARKHRGEGTSQGEHPPGRVGRS